MQEEDFNGKSSNFCVSSGSVNSHSFYFTNQAHKRLYRFSLYYIKSSIVWTIYETYRSLRTWQQTILSSLLRSITETLVCFSKNLSAGIIRMGSRNLTLSSPNSQSGTSTVIFTSSRSGDFNSLIIPSGKFTCLSQSGEFTHLSKSGDLTCLSQSGDCTSLT